MKKSAVCLLAVSALLVACGGGSNSSTPAASSITPSSSSSVASSSSLSSSSSSSSSSLSSSASSLATSAASAGGFAKGADVGWLTEMEASGKKFYNKAGVQKDLLDILKEQGMDSIRLRVWVNPADGTYHNMTDVLAKAKRAKTAGMRLMIDFHYSDTWADPGKQGKPAQWSAYNITQLVTAVADHTRNSLIMLRDAGITPEWVQVGNETNNGMLWEEGRASVNMGNFARLVTGGYDAVKEIFPQTKVIVHISNCHDNSLFRWIFDGLKNNGGKFDVIGASSYPTTNTGSTWQATNTACATNLNDMVARYKVPVIIAEVGVPWDHASAKTIVADLIAKARAVNGGQGLGIFYWEPEAYGGWKGYTLGAFDNAGKPAAAMDAFLE